MQTVGRHMRSVGEIGTQDNTRSAPTSPASVRLIARVGAGVTQRAARSILMPFFGDLHSENGRDLLRHYVADFLMSTEPS